MINKIAKKIYNQYKMSIIAKKVFYAALTDQQKTLVDEYTNKRQQGLSFGPMFSSDRTYFNIGKSSLSVIETPQQIVDILDKQGYYCPDYREGYVYKKDDKLKSKPVKLIRILKKGVSDNQQFNMLKKQFDQRMGTSRKQMKSCLICITHNPYDVAGMSTDRNWTSCMNLDGGAYSSTALKQVKYGGMCAYLIQDDDKTIQNPIARIAIKRLVGENGGFMFVAQSRIYGDVAFANELNFMNEVIKILQESNNKTIGEELIFNKKDDGSYSDAGIYRRYMFKSDEQMMEYINGNEEYFTDEDFLGGLDLDRLHYLFPQMMKFLDEDEQFIYKLAKNGKLTQDQRKQFVEALFSNKKLGELKNMFKSDLLNDEQIERLVKYNIKWSVNNGYFNLEDFIESEKTSDDLKDRIIDLYIKNYQIMSDFIINGKLNREQKNKIIQHYFDNENYYELFLFLDKNKLNDENKIQLKQNLKKFISNLDSYKDDYYELFKCSLLDENDREQIIKYCIKKKIIFVLYDMIEDESKNHMLTQNHKDELIQFFIDTKRDATLMEIISKHNDILSEKQEKKIEEYLGIPSEIKI